LSATSSGSTSEYEAKGLALTTTIPTQHQYDNRLSKDPTPCTQRIIKIFKISKKKKKKKKKKIPISSSQNGYISIYMKVWSFPSSQQEDNLECGGGGWGFNSGRTWVCLGFLALFSFLGRVTCIGNVVLPQSGSIEATPSSRSR